MVFEFDGYRLDAARVALTGPDGPIHVEPQVFRVLLHLVENHERLVTKEELLDTIWGSRFVSESALTSRLKAARRAIGDDGRDQRTIKTVHGLGYRFVADVRRVEDATAHGRTTPARMLPAPRTELIGRDRDLPGVVETVRSARAVTIVGPGGVGKTTLALAAGRELLADFADGAIFVDLTATSSSDEVARALADAAGVQGDASRSVDRLAELLSARPVLIVLDNCEHVLADAAHVVDLLLERGSAARVLATSREPLGVPGEHVWPLEPLEATAPQLFVARARAADPRVRWDPDDPRIVELCNRLDGLPLALELAAGQLRRWDFDELSRQLQGELSPLAASAHRIEHRHGTMAAAIDWSYQLLDPAERSLLRHVSVFPSSFTLRSAEAIVAPLPDVAMPTTLGDLVDKSLVVRDPTSGRFRLLETIRVFAREHLEISGEAGAASERLRQHVVDAAAATSRLDRWNSARLAADRREDGDQWREAFWASLHSGHVADAVEIAMSSSFLWRNSIGCTEGGQWVDELLRHDLSPADRMWVLILRADVGEGNGDFREMMIASNEAKACDVGSDPAASCIAAHYGALVHLTAPEGAHEGLDAIRRMAPDARLDRLLRAFMIVPKVAAGGGDELVDDLETLHRTASDDGYDRFILNWAGWLFGLARRRQDEASKWMDRQREFLDRTGIVETWLSSLSHSLTESIDGTDVSAMVRGALDMADREGYRAEADCALGLAYAEACRGNAESGAELIGTAVQNRFNSTAHYVLYRVVVEPVVRAQVDSDTYAEAFARGRRRSAVEALRAHGVC